MFLINAPGNGDEPINAPGNGDEPTVLRYAHLSSEHLKEAANRI